MDPAAGTNPGPGAFAEMIAASDVVYVGESHDQKFAHLAQLEALKILASARKNKVAVGFEMLNSGLQPVLEKYAAGKISEKEFLESADWKKEWGFDFGLYKPLFDYIRKNKLKAAALNVPRAVIKKIARGGMGSLSPGEKRTLPEKVEINRDPLYVSYLRSTYGGHGDNPMAKVITWDNYLLSMAAWNEGMADSAVKAMKKHKGYAMLVVAGNGHIVYNAGIPFSIKTRMPGLKHLSVYTEDLEKAEDFREDPSPLADLVWFVRHERAAAPPAVPADTPKTR
ncbi:MAG: ChaN family lipoprotein, partial [Elusimicrobiales bacterium]|nr:ChaN family lipoprotein [Elusimicrobiales bacterium]